MESYEQAAAAVSGPPARFARLPPARSAAFSWSLRPAEVRLLSDGASSLWRWQKIDGYGLLPFDWLEQAGLGELVDALLKSRCIEARDMVWANVALGSEGDALDHGAAWLGHSLFGAPNEAGCAELVGRSLDRLIASGKLAPALKAIQPSLRLRRVATPPRLGKNAALYELTVPSAALNALSVWDQLDPLTSLFLPRHDLLGPVGIVRGTLGAADRGATSRITLIALSTPEGDWIGLSAARKELVEVMASLGAPTAAAPAAPPPHLAPLALAHTLSGEYEKVESLARLWALEPALASLSQGADTAAALDTPIVSSTRLLRTPRSVEARVSHFIAPEHVALLRSAAALSGAELKALGLESLADAPP
jgi:hypothetical protein